MESEGESAFQKSRIITVPTEVLHHISQFLGLKDILNCSLTGHYLRDALNYDLVWKRFVPDNISQLKSQNHSTDPQFCWDDTLGPPCRNRVYCMMKYHLLNNWKCANFAKHTSTLNLPYASGAFDVSKGKGQIFFKDLYFLLGQFINYIGSHRLEMWDISKKPLYRSFVNIIIDHFDFAYFFKSNIVIVECGRVSVFKVDATGKQCPLLFFFFIREESVSTQERGKRCESLNCRDWSHYVVGHFLVSNKSSDEGNTFHVWNIETATKVGTFVVPIENLLQSVSVESTEGDLWLLKCKEEINVYEQEFYILFNIQDKTFSNTLLYNSFAHQAVLYKSCALIFQRTVNPSGGIVCTVLDFNICRITCRRIFREFDVNFSVDNCSIKVINDTFVLLSHQRVYIIDALTLSTVEEFESGIPIGFAVGQFILYCNLFVLVCGFDNNLYIMDMKHRQRGFKDLSVNFTSGHNIYLNETCTKMVVLTNVNINVLNFW